MDLREGFSSPKRRSSFEAHRYCVSLRPILEKVRHQARVSVPIETSQVIPVATSTPGTSAGKPLQVSLECEKYTRLSPYRDRLEPGIVTPILPIHRMTGGRDSSVTWRIGRLLAMVTTGRSLLTLISRAIPKQWVQWSRSWLYWHGWRGVVSCSHFGSRKVPRE